MTIKAKFITANICIGLISIIAGISISGFQEYITKPFNICYILAVAAITVLLSKLNYNK